MDPDYFQDLAGVTHVTRPGNGCVTPEGSEEPRKQAKSAGALRTSRLLRAESAESLGELTEDVGLQARPEDEKTAAAARARMLRTMGHPG